MSHYRTKGWFMILCFVFCQQYGGALKKVQNGDEKANRRQIACESDRESIRKEIEIPKMRTETNADIARAFALAPSYSASHFILSLKVLFILA